MIRLISFIVYYLAVLICLCTGVAMAWHDRWVWAIIFIVLAVLFMPSDSEKR